jgi:hypothetical protein
MTRSKDLGTACETAVVRYLQKDGFPHAERRALRGTADAGDITGTPGICWEIKGGEAAKAASDKQVTAWLAETETERVNARADIGLLVLQRRGVGPGNAGRWWVVLTSRTFLSICPGVPMHAFSGPTVPVQLTLERIVVLLRFAGYGQPHPAVTS